MGVEYAELTRTKSGALTAESKRILATERAEQDRQWNERCKKQIAVREALGELEEATQLFEAVTDYSDNEPQTEREERIIEHALAAHRVDVFALTEKDATDLYRDLRETWGFESDIADQIYRIAHLGLDQDMTTLEILNRLLDQEQQIGRGRA